MFLNISVSVVLLIGVSRGKDREKRVYVCIHMYIREILIMRLFEEQIRDPSMSFHARERWWMEVCSDICEGACCATGER